MRRRRLARVMRSAILHPMSRKLSVAIVGPGRLGTTLALELVRRGYRVREIVSRNQRESIRRARELAKKVRARATTIQNPGLDADVIWFCVSDRSIRAVAQTLASATNWKGKIALHSSGALDSDELAALKQNGAAVASVHPLMTFVRGSAPSLRGVAFGIEGDPRALSAVRRIIPDLGGEVMTIPRTRKVAYHAWGAFASPLLLSLLITAERVAQLAGLSPAVARKKMVPIVRQTLENYANLGPADAFSGPIVRGDVAIVRQHLRALQKAPDARQVYSTLARAALRYLPSRNRKELEKLLRF